MKFNRLFVVMFLVILQSHIGLSEPIDLMDYEYLQHGFDSQNYLFKNSLNKNVQTIGSGLSPIGMPGSDPVLGEPEQFRSTHYHTVVAEEVADGVDLLVNSTGAGPKISSHDFCTASMEGAISVKRVSGGLEHFSFIRSSKSCSEINMNMCLPYRGRALGCAVFKQSNYPLGSNGRALLPYRTIAIGVKSSLQAGQIIFIDEAVGVLVTMPDGVKVKHDGYFKVADRGSFIGQKLDIYIGSSPARRPRAPAFTNQQITVRRVNYL